MLRAKFDTLGHATQKALGPTGANYSTMESHLNDQRILFNQHARALQGVSATTSKLVPETELFTKRLKEQRVTLGEMLKSHEKIRNVAREQVNLQRAYAISVTQDAQGRHITDLMVPQVNASSFQKARAIVGTYGAAISSAGDQMIKFGKNTQWTGRQLTVGFSVPLSIAAAATGKLAYDIDKALTSITKVYGDANARLQDSVESIRHASWQTAKSMSQLYGQAAAETLDITQQFAATGKQGAELQEAVAAATKARTLNEIDLQTAIEASITMQTVYGYSAEELGQKWDYINAIANQTILQAEDFAVAIPKVAGLIRDLGGDIEDLGVMMTAMRAAGISAAEGANALKTISFRSIAPFERGMKSFTDATGKDLKKIIEQTNGEVIPTLNQIFLAMEGLSKGAKIQVVKDLFGVYQGNKALNLLNQLAAQSGQVAQAMAVGENSIAENAAIAWQELERMNDQPFKKIDKAIQMIKNSMVEVGAAILPSVVTIAETIESIVGWFADLGDTAKKNIVKVLGIVAISGPIVMLAGLFTNFMGIITKLSGGFLKLSTMMGLVTREEARRKLMARDAANSWDTQSAAVARMNMALEKYYTLLASHPGIRKAQLEQAGYTRGVYDYGHKPVINKAGVQAGQTFMREQNAWFNPSGQGFATMEEAAKDFDESMKKANNTAKDMQARTAGIASNISNMAMLAGVFTQMFTDNQGIINASYGLAGLGMAMSMFPGIAQKGVRGVAKAFGKLDGVFGGALGKLKALKLSLAGVAGPATAAAAALAIAYMKYREQAQERAELIRSMKDSEEAWSELLSFNLQDPIAVLQERGATGQEITKAMVLKLRETNEEMIKFFDSQQTRDAGERWAIAIEEGFKVINSGGTEEMAKQAVRTALQAMDIELRDADFEAELKLRIDFQNPEHAVENAVSRVLGQVQEAVNDTGEGWEKWTLELWGGRGAITDYATDMGKKSADDFYKAFLVAGREEQVRMVDEVYRGLMEELRAMYERTNKHMEFSEFVQKALGRDFTDIWPGNLFNNDDAKELIKMINYLEVFSGSLSEVGEISWDVEEGLSVLFARMSGVEQVELSAGQMADYQLALRMAAAAGADLTEEEKELIRMNIYTGRSADELSDSLGGIEDAAEDAAEGVSALQSALDNAGIDQFDAGEVEGHYRSMMQNAQGAMFEAANDALQRAEERAMDALEASQDAVMDDFERRSDALDALYERRGKALEDSQEKRDESFKKSWDARIKREESAYDRRIENIDKLVDAEKKAQEIREKVFEDEKKRVERLAKLYNTSIDINTAIQSGNLDEAAKLVNDTIAQQADWALDDSGEIVKSESDKKIEALEKSKKLIEEEKKTRVDMLEEVRKAEEKALKNRFEMEKESLKNSEKIAKKRLDAEKEASRRSFETRKDNLKRSSEENQRALQRDLDMLKLSLPKNKAEYDQQAKRIEEVFKKHGITLTNYGKGWSETVGDYMYNAVEASGKEVKNSAEWKNIGAVIAEGILEGAFGMSPAEFSKWLNGGQAPAGSLMSPSFKPIVTTRPSTWTAGKTVARGQVMKYHTGGMIGENTGLSGSLDRLSKDEVPLIGLKGEAVLNREATGLIGPKAIEEMNKGIFPKDTGPWGSYGMNFIGLGAAMVGGLLKATIADVIRAVVAKRIETTGERGIKLPSRFFSDKNQIATSVNMAPYLGAMGLDMGDGSWGFKSGDWWKPLKKYRLSSEYGNRYHPIDKIWRLHAGIDLAAPTGTNIYAAGAGRVIHTGYSGGRGNLTILSHGNGINTNYAHQSAFGVRKGQTVKGGQYIGKVGSTGKSTGPHLHFEVTRNGAYTNPRNIIPNFEEGGYIWKGGLANLHDKEMVLSEPLTNKLHEGLDRMAGGGTTVYTVRVDMRNSTFEREIDVTRAVEKALLKAGRNNTRRIGKK